MTRFAALAFIVLLGAALGGAASGQTPPPAPRLTAPPIPRPSYTPLPTPAPMPSPTPTMLPSADAATLAQARDEFLAWQRGTPDATRYTSDMRTSMTSDVLAEARSMLAPFGAPSSFMVQQHATLPDMYVFAVTCTGGTVYETLARGRDGKIAALFFHL